MLSDSLSPFGVNAKERQVLSVSQLNQAAKNLLDTYLPLLWVEGELSNYSTPSSGHWYFTLKDARAQVRCAMFKNRNQSVLFKPKPGDKVVLRAKASLYEGRGDYQLIVEHMEPAGAGDLQQQFERLKAKLSAEGLFDEQYKLELPEWPQKLGIITSSTGAAIHDVLNVLKRRFPSLPVVILPVSVQGAAAAGQIAEAIKSANKHTVCDVLLVTRGGGSIEDLWAFNEEVVARAVFDSEIPIISAIGHEVDFTICDFVADVRAPTPSAAAEILSANQEELQQTLSHYQKTITRYIEQYLKSTQQQLQHVRARLQSPRQILTQQAQSLDQLELRMKQSMNARLKNERQSITSLQKRVEQSSPSKHLAHKKQNLSSLQKRLMVAIKHQQSTKSQQLKTVAGLLNGVSPLNTLNRGYSILMTAQGKAVRSAKEVKQGDTLQARLHQGSFDCKVLTVKPE